MKILITGASGYLGSRIAAYYKNKYTVLIPGHLEMDICEKQSVRDYFMQTEPDIVIHCAAVSEVVKCEENPKETWKVNVVGSFHVADAAKSVKAKCILCSSDQVYFGSSIRVPHREEEELVPFNEYGRQKLQMEKMCLENDSDAVILRLSWMYDVETFSKREHGDFIKTLLEKLADKVPLAYPVYDRRGITNVNEVVQNMEKAFLLPGGIYNFGAANNANTYETVVRVLGKLGADQIKVHENRMAFVKNPRNICMNMEKLEKHGIYFSDTEDGLVNVLGCIY